MEQKIIDLQTALDILQSAYDAGIKITGIKSLDDDRGWEISFSDHSVITVGNNLLYNVESNDKYITIVMRDGTSFMFQFTPDSIGPKLISFSILAKDNPLQMVENAECEIIGDSIVECWVKNIMSNKQLIANFYFEGNEVYLNDSIAESGTTSTDFRKPVKLTIASGSRSKDYTVYVHSYTGLPIIWIETVGRQEIISKEEYLKASFKLQENVITRGAGDVLIDSVLIKGRGNTTWGMPKKPYRLKFDKKQSLLGEPMDKSWVLLSNYADKTMLRVYTAFYMGYISNLDYTPKSHFAELILNGQYNGTYLVCDKIKISADRVNVGNDGFLLEVDTKAEDGDITFRLDHISEPINIKEPENISVGDDNYNYITAFMSKADSALYSSNFTDPDNGWQKYIDMDSFVDWYLINEITKNNDALMYSSCYMNLKRGGKIKMGPLWDFDLAMGNLYYNVTCYYDGLWMRYAEWINRMFDDPVFVSKVKERFDYFYGRKDDIMRTINENAQYLRYAVKENENRWHTFYEFTWPNYDIWGSYQNEVQSMKEWLNSRFEWLKAEFDKM
ncbi:MAG: CotH kinase family protein [Prevotella sp.]|nr:CotH kinase family protein [Prevotella sp.]